MRSFLRNIRIKFGKFIIDHVTVGVLSALPPKNILFLRQDGKIGDYIVSSFVFRELKKFDPRIKIGVVCTKKDAYLFEQNPYIDKLYFVKKRSILDYIKHGFLLRKEQYDVIIDPTIALKNRDLLLLRLIKAKNYVGYKKSNYSIFNLNLEGEYHFSELYRLALEKIGINIHNKQYDVPFNSQNTIEIADFLAKNNIKNYLAINFFGAYRAKKVNNENIKRYLKYLTKITNKPLILLSYPEVTETLKSLSQGYPTVFVHDTTTIFHSIELIRHCDQLISTDTATVHIASGFNKPMIAIYKNDPIAFIHWQPMSTAPTEILFYQENINEIQPEQIKPEWLIL